MFQRQKGHKGKQSWTSALSESYAQLSVGHEHNCSEGQLNQRRVQKKQPWGQLDHRRVQITLRLNEII